MAQPTLITASEVADRCGIDRSTLTRWIKDGIARPAQKLPGHTGAFLFDASEADRLLPIANERFEQRISKARRSRSGVSA
ncbi:MAG: hypothetical protein WA994_11655 [Ornithinimicrobium sp.]